MKKQSLILGTLILGVAGIIAKFLGLFFRWPLQMLIGDEGVGYYQMSFPLYMFFIALASGIPVAISKMVSEYKALGNDQLIIQVLKKATFLMLLLSTCFSAVLFIFAKPIIGLLKWDSKSYYSLVALAFAPLFIPFMSVLRGFFQGLQNMTYSGISQILEQIGRVVVGVGLAYLFLPMGIQYAAGGAALGAAAGAIAASLYLGFKYIKIRKSFKVTKLSNNNNVLRDILVIALPISFGAAVGTIMTLIDSVIVPQKLLIAGLTFKEATILYGQLTGKAFILTNLPLTLSTALCASLVPIIAEAYVLNHKFQFSNKVQLAIRISMVIALPSFLGLFFLAAPILNLLFPGQSEGYEILRWMSLSIPFIVVAQTSTAILQGVGYYFIPVINLLIGCIFKVVITLMLVPIPHLNIYGAVIGTIAGYVVAAILNMRSLKKDLKISIDYYDAMIKPAYASTFMIMAVVFVYENAYNYTENARVACLISIVLGILIYGLLIVIFGVLNYGDIKKRFISNRRRKDI